MASSVLARLAVIIDGQTASFNKAMSQSAGQLETFSKTVSKVGALVGVSFGTAAVFNGLVDAVGILKGFEKQMDIVASITGATGAEFDSLRDSAIQLGKATQFSSTEVAELQTEFGRLGFSTREILAATEATIDLSIATGEDLAKSADIAGSTIRSFGLDATETGRVVDVMAESFNKSALGLDNFGEAMKYVGPIAAQAGLSIEETTALLGTLADAGIRGSSAGTSLRKIITDLGTGSGTLSEKLKALADKGLTGAEAMSEVGRTAYASLLILAKNTEKTEGLTTALNGAAGAAKKTADIVGDNLQGDVSALSGAYESLILSGSGATSILREFTQAATKILNLLSNNTGIVSEFLSQLTKIGPIGDAINLVKLFNRIGDSADDAGAKLAALNEKNKAIEATVKAAFDSGNVEAYIKALDQNIYKEEIIAAIRAKQNADIIEGVTGIKQQVGIITELEEKLKQAEQNRKDAFSVPEIQKYNAEIEGLKKRLEALNGTKVEKTLTGLEALQKTLRDLSDQYNKTDAADRAGLVTTAAKIDATQTLIDRLERLKKSIGQESVVPNLALGQRDTRDLFDPAKILEDSGKNTDMIFEKLLEKSKKGTAKISKVVGDIGPQVAGAVGGALTGLGEALGQSLAGVGDFGSNILKVVLAFAKQLGEILIGIGTAMLATRELLINPYTAIVAGVVLVALAGAASAAISRAHSNAFGGSSAGANDIVNTQAVTSAGNYVNSAAGAQTVNFVIQGPNLVGVLSNQGTKNGRLKG